MTLRSTRYRRRPFTTCLKLSRLCYMNRLKDKFRSNTAVLYMILVQARCISWKAKCYSRRIGKRQITNVHKKMDFVVALLNQVISQVDIISREQARFTGEMRTKALTPRKVPSGIVRIKLIMKHSGT